MRLPWARSGVRACGRVYVRACGRAGGGCVGAAVLGGEAGRGQGGGGVEAGWRRGDLLLSEVLEQDGAAAAARAAVAQQRLAQRDGGCGMGALLALPRLEAWPPPLGEVTVR